MELFKIECNGQFKAQRGDLLVSTVHEETKEESDILLVSSEGDIIPTHRSVLALHGSIVPSLVGAHCSHTSTAISLPFSSKTISAFLKLVAYGCSSPLDRQGLASLTELTQVLNITMQGLEISQQKQVVTLEVGEGNPGLKSLLASNGPAREPPRPNYPPPPLHRKPHPPQKQHRKQPNPQHLLQRQRDAVAKDVSSNMALTSVVNKDISGPIMEEDVIEITPEMYANHQPGEDDNIALIPQHFLMQDGEESYGEPTPNGGSSPSAGSAWPNIINGALGTPAWHDGPVPGLDGVVGAPGDALMGHVTQVDGSQQSVYTAPEVREVTSDTDPEVKVYECSFCPGQIFKKKNDINRHLKKHVPIELRKRFQCELCKEKFINNSNLKVHTKVCTGVVKQFVCKKCGDVQYNKTDHLDHLARTHNINKKHGCPICHKQLKKTSDLRKHMATHSNQKPFACDVCGKRFKTESYVKVHMKAHYVNGHLPSNGLDVANEEHGATVDESVTRPEDAHAQTAQRPMPDEDNRGDMADHADKDNREDMADHADHGNNDGSMPVDENGVDDDEERSLQVDLGEVKSAIKPEETGPTSKQATTTGESPVKQPDQAITANSVSENDINSSAVNRSANAKSVMEEELHDEEMEEEELEEEEEGTDGGVSEDTDTPTGVQTPETGGEGGSTGDEMEMHQRSLAFGNKDLYVNQINVFRNSTEIA